MLRLRALYMQMRHAQAHAQEAQAHAQEAQAPAQEAQAHDARVVAVVPDPQSRHSGSAHSPLILDSDQSSEDGNQTPTYPAVVPNSPAPSSPLSQYTPSHVAFSPATAAARLAVFGMPQPRLLC